jgi:hypothetical protein
MKRLFQYSEPDEALISARRKDAEDYKAFLQAQNRDGMLNYAHRLNGTDRFSHLYDATFRYEKYDDAPFSDAPEVKA